MFTGRTEEKDIVWQALVGHAIRLVNAGLVKKGGADFRLAGAAPSELFSEVRAAGAKNPAQSARWFQFPALARFSSAETASSILA